MKDHMMRPCINNENHVQPHQKQKHINRLVLHHFVEYNYESDSTINEEPPPTMMELNNYICHKCNDNDSILLFKYKILFGERPIRNNSPYFLE